MEVTPPATFTRSRKKTDMARRHVDEIRKRKFSIGEEAPNPLTQDLHNAVTNLSSELYTKDIHFLMELIQNAEDNEYSQDVQPTLEFVLTTQDITGLGSPATLLVFNNEVGFSRENIESLCSIGRSTKKGRRRKGFIGEKGIGFKSVFLVSSRPHVFSNGYQIRFNEAPNSNCGIGYIVPEWVGTRPAISDLQSIYGSCKILPNTTIILPLKPEKLETVKKHLSELHPEVLLFLHKIRRLTVRENSSSSPDTVSAISISSESNLISLPTDGADSRMVHLSVQEEAERTEATCCYYIYKQVFPVNPGNVVDNRKDINEWVISLAFPFGDRLRRGTSSVGIFAFLPTAMVTNFPFVVQADFILASSREAILLDNKWNLGILDHIPSSFVNALMTCMKSNEMAELFPMACVLEFLPVLVPPLKQLNTMRESIRIMVKLKRIVPCESFLTEEIVFCKPSDVIRILPEFRKILSHIKELNIPLSGISSHRKFFLHNTVDKEKYDEVWNFLGVPSANHSYEWYGKCIQTCNHMFRASTEVYVELLCFLADNWDNLPFKILKTIPLLECIGWNGQVLPCSVLQVKSESWKVHLVWEAQQHSWLNKWNVEIGCPDDSFFFQDAIVTAILGHKKKESLRSWLIYKVGVVVTDVYIYCSKLGNILKTRMDPELAVSLAHLVYHSALKNYIGANFVSDLLRSIPVVDASGNVSICTTSLMPASRSKWVKLFGSSNIFTGDLKDKRDEAYSFQKYVELGEVYAEAAEFAGECTPVNELLNFLIGHGKAKDLPDIEPQDRALNVASNQLTSDQALLLLEWIRNLRDKKYYSPTHKKTLNKYKIPARFFESIRCGKWIKTYSGYSTPSSCYLRGVNESSPLIEIAKVLEALSAIDEEYYEHRIRSFKDELMFIGVQIGTENMYQLIIDHFKPLVSSAMRRHLAISLLSFIRYSIINDKLDGDFLKTLREGKWMKAVQGYVSPPGAVYILPDIGEAVLDITDLQVIDTAYYGSELSGFVHELKLLGIIVHMKDVYKLIPESFKLPKDLSKLTKDAVLLLLKCIQKLGPAAAGLTEKITCQPCIKTTGGLKRPSESLLLDPNWGHLVNIVPLPIIDEAYYGSRVRSYKAEWEAIGVRVNLDQACNMLIVKVKSLLSSSGLTGACVISLLNCLKCMSKTMPSQLSHLMSFLSGEKWLKTCHGYRSASESILFDSKWGTVSQLIDLPLIDVAFYGLEIFSFKDELEMLGVVINFNEGAHFIARGLEFTNEQVSVSADCALSLLHCAGSLRNSSKSSDQSLLENLHNKLKGSNWLKTHMGYRTPEESLIFNPEWTSYLEEQDGPFIDQGFYGPLSSLEKDELKAIGVKTDTVEVCTSIFQVLTSHEETHVVMRIYRFMHKNNWSSNSGGYFTSQLWIPDPRGTGGKWVNNWVCVLHDRNNLFGSFLHILDKYYEKELLSFISTTFGVDEFPTLCRYMDLWEHWVTHNHSVSFVQLDSFWGYIAENWNPFTEKTTRKAMTTLPATTIAGTVQLVDRNEVFIPDDLQLKKSFAKASGKPLFVWFPQNGSASLTKLYEIYLTIGVRKISESVQFSVKCQFEKMDLDGSLIGKSMMKIILAFLGKPMINMPVEARHRIARSLIDVSVFGTSRPLMVRYSLQLPSSKKRLQVEISKLVIWDRKLQRLLVHEPSLKGGQKDMELATNFAQSISEAALPNVGGLVDDLGKIIKMGFLFGFEENVVDSLLLTENLELSVADANFLECTFPSGTATSPVSMRRRLLTSWEAPCTPETSLHKKRRES